MLTSLKKGIHKNVRRKKHKNVSKKCIKMSEGRERVKNWPEFTISGEIFSWIKFREQWLQAIFAWFSSDMGLFVGDLIRKILRYTYPQSRMLICGLYILVKLICTNLKTLRPHFENVFCVIFFFTNTKYQNILLGLILAKSP